jgi:thiol:disulfide interchange protein
MFKKLFGLLFFIAAANNLFAQDSSALAWQTKLQPISALKYKLTLQVVVPSGATLYAPNQNLADIKSAEVFFTDSTIKVESIKANSPTISQKIEAFENTAFLMQKDTAIWEVVFTNANANTNLFSGTVSYYYNKADEFVAGQPFTFAASLTEGTNGNLPTVTTANAAACGDTVTTEKTSLAKIFLFGFLGGLVALLTPCVFPMIPVTVTFFTKKASNRKKAIVNASLYGLFIFIIYVAVSAPFHLASNVLSPDIFNNISTNVWVNLVFFIVFVLFALSFFGLFEIVLPASVANAADSKSGLSNIGGIFFMALTLAIVSFSCTGPILGTLLANVNSNGQGAWPLTAGTAGFGVALGLPFALFALFPNWLQSLPKSGGWMTDVKVVLGFVELALAVKFLANADNVQQWGIIKREVFIAAWLIIAVCIVLYLLGKLKIGHSTAPQKFSKTRFGFIAFFAALALYLVPGLFNTKFGALRLLSGFPPPVTYSLYSHHVLLANRVQPIHNNLNEAIAAAKAQNKPILIDFTGWACVNCRKMEDEVWPDQQVNKLMTEDFIVVSLYVDEKVNLPANEQSIATLKDGSKKTITTVGDKWSTFQQENFGAIAQPQYAIINANLEALTKTKFFTTNATEFAKWLQCGISSYKK